MRYALISDIHANLPALEATLSDIAARPDVAATYHLGDLVGYAPWPNEVVSRIQTAGISGIAGNYDSTVGLDYERQQTAPHVAILVGRHANHGHQCRRIGAATHLQVAQ